MPRGYSSSPSSLPHLSVRCDPMGSAGVPPRAVIVVVTRTLGSLYSNGRVDKTQGRESPFQTLFAPAPRGLFGGRGGGRRVPYLERFLLRGPLNSLVDQESRSRGIHSRFQSPRARPPRRFASVGRLAMASRGLPPGSRWMGSVDDWPMAKPETKSNRRYPPAEGR